MNQWLDEMGFKPGNGACRSKSGNLLASLLADWAWTGLERMASMTQIRIFHTAPGMDQDWDQDQWLTKQFLHLSWSPRIIISMCPFPIPTVSIIVKTLAWYSSQSRSWTRSHASSVWMSCYGLFRQNLCRNGTRTGTRMGHSILYQTFALQLMWELKRVLYFGVVSVPVLVPVPLPHNGVFILAVSRTAIGTETWIMKNGLYDFKKNLSHCTWTGTGKNGLFTHFSSPETVSGGVFRMYFNGFQVFSPGPKHRQCEWFLHNIGPGPCPCPGPGDSQCEYTISYVWISRLGPGKRTLSIWFWTITGINVFFGNSFINVCLKSQGPLKIRN